MASVLEEGKRSLIIFSSVSVTQEGPEPQAEPKETFSIRHCGQPLPTASVGRGRGGGRWVAYFPSGRWFSGGEVAVRALCASGTFC